MGGGIARFGRRGLKTTNLKILVSKFVPRGFEARRTWGFKAQRHGVLRGSAKGFLGAAPRGFEAQQHGTGLSREYFLYFSATDFKPQSVW